MKSIIALSLLFAVISAANAQGWILDLLASPFKTIQEAPYDVIQTFPNGVEERVYPSKSWVTTERILEEKGMDNIRREMFMTLFHYITGTNKENAKIPMTKPVATKVEGVGGWKTSYQMGFFVPEEHQMNPPTPTDPNVKIVERKPHVYAMKFGGYADESDYQENLEFLQAFLKSEGITVPLQPSNKEPYYFYAGYDSPMKFWNRRNEVWIKAE